MSHHQAVKETRKIFHKQRSMLYKRQDWNGYTHCVAANRKGEEIELETVTSQVCQELNIEEHLYKDSMKHYSETDTVILQQMMQIKQESLAELDWVHGLAPMNFSEEETFRLFKIEKEEETELYVQAILAGDVDRVRATQDETKIEEFTEVLKQRAQDTLLHHHGVKDLGEYDAAVMWYKIE